MRHLPVVLTMAAALWPAVLGAAVADRATHVANGVVASVVYAAAKRICHQRPERSFETRGQPWPVCGRCAGLYLAAPLGAALALASVRRRRHHTRALLVIAAVPTAGTLLLEWLSPGSASSFSRALAAIPLGMAVAYAIVGTAGQRDSIG